MPLTFEKRERRAYADGRLQEAAVLREAVDVTDDRIGELEYEVRLLKKDITDLEYELAAVRDGSII